jgi:copper resistance protein B
MRIKSFMLASSFMLLLGQPAQAADDTMDMVADMQHEHGGGIFHMFRSETDIGSNTDSNTVASWDVKGWVGTDENKLYLKTEGEHKDRKLESAEVWTLYSRNIATFWDAQVGIRYDFKPKSTTYLTLGFNGLAPYYFETEAHLFISDKGDASARLREENDFLLTQKLIVRPYAEINLFAQKVPTQEVGAGLSDGKIGLQTRYEFTRKFAPYVDVHYGRKFGETSALTQSNGEDKETLAGAIGLRLMF